MNQELYKQLIKNLNKVEVSGSNNMILLLSTIQTLEQLANATESKEEAENEDHRTE